MSRCRELGGHLGVHGDHHLLFVRHEGVAVLDLHLHPSFELLSKHSCANIDDPLLRNLRQIDLVREILTDSRFVADEVHDLLQRQVLVLGDMQSLDVVDIQVRFLSRQYIFEEVNGCVI